MNNKEALIPADEFCTYYEIETSFIYTLNEYKLIELLEQEGKIFIHFDALPAIEKCIRLHYDLSINMEGIEAVTHLLSRVEHLQQEVATLKNRLHFYEK